jgi:hypothetical protein
MRITYSALITLMLASAVPSVGLAQVLSPFLGKTLREERRLDHVVPVATVNLVGDMVALADPRVVDDPSGEPFVLGAASLDLRDPSHAKITFTMTNISSEPMPWDTVRFDVRSVTRPDVVDRMRGAPALFIGCRIGRLGLAGSPRELWQPGATVTVQVPIAPYTNCTQGSELQGFLVYAGSVLPHPDLLLGPSAPGWDEAAAEEKALFHRAFEKLTSRTQQ